MQCPKCKAEVNPQAQFCWQCGATIASGSAAAALAPAGGNRRAAVAGGVAALILLLAIILGVATRSRSRSVTAGGDAGSASAGRVSATHPGGVAPSTPVTAVAPGNVAGGSAVNATSPGGSSTGSALTATPPGNPPAGSGVASGTAPTPNPYAADVAAYLGKLEVIEARDAQNPMAQLFAMMATGLSSMADAMKGLTGDDVGEAPSANTASYQRTFDQMLQAKQGLIREFRAITPVPAPCQRLHQTYGYYLETQERAIRELSGAISQGGNPGAPLAALPIGKTAENAQAIAAREEDTIRRQYGVPRNAAPIVP